MIIVNISLTLEYIKYIVYLEYIKVNIFLCKIWYITYDIKNRLYKKIKMILKFLKYLFIKKFIYSYHIFILYIIYS